MKSVSIDFVNQLDTARIITGARAVLRANRLKFSTQRDISHTDAAFSDPSYAAAYDVAVVTSDTRYTNPILRIAYVYDGVSAYKLAYQYLTAPRADVSLWNHWTVTTKTVNLNSKPGVFNNRIFYQRSDNVCVWLDYNYTNGSLGSETTIFTAANGNDIIAFAPARTSAANAPATATWKQSSTRSCRALRSSINCLLVSWSSRSADSRMAIAPMRLATSSSMIRSSLRNGPSSEGGRSSE